MKRTSPKKIYDLAIINFEERFSERIEKLVSRLTALGLERVELAEPALKEKCSSFIFDKCFSNKERFRLFSKQFSSEENYAVAIVNEAFAYTFKEYYTLLNQIANK